MESKPLFASKTFWVNIVAGMAALTGAVGAAGHEDRRHGQKVAAMSKPIVIALAAGLMLSGCGGPLGAVGSALGINSLFDDKAEGITAWDVEICERKNPPHDLYPCKLKVRDGKERGSLKITGNIKNGDFSYTSKDTTAFEGQAIRKEAEKAIAATGAKVTSKLVDLFLRAQGGFALPVGP